VSWEGLEWESQGRPSEDQPLRDIAATRGALHIGGRSPATVDIPAPPPTERLGPQLPLKQHEAPHLGAVGTDVGLDVGSHLTDGGQVDAEQLRAPLQWRRDRPTQVRVVPCPHQRRLPELMF
jgi:hypothetical protein